MLSAAERYSQIGKNDIAVEKAKEFIAKDSRNPDGYNALANIYKKEGKIEEAIDSYSKSRNLKKPNVLADKEIQKLQSQITPVEEPKENVVAEPQTDEIVAPQTAPVQEEEEAADEFDFGTMGDNVPMGEALLEKENDFFDDLDKATEDDGIDEEPDSPDFVDADESESAEKPAAVPYEMPASDGYGDKEKDAAGNSGSGEDNSGDAQDSFGSGEDSFGDAENASGTGEENSGINEDGSGTGDGTGSSEADDSDPFAGIADDSLSPFDDFEEEPLSEAEQLVPGADFSGDEPNPFAEKEDGSPSFLEDFAEDAFDFDQFADDSSSVAEPEPEPVSDYGNGSNNGNSGNNSGNNNGFGSDNGFDSDFNDSLAQPQSQMQSQPQQQYQNEPQTQQPYETQPQSQPQQYQAPQYQAPQNRPYEPQPIYQPQNAQGITSYDLDRFARQMQNSVQDAIKDSTKFAVDTVMNAQAEQKAAEEVVEAPVIDEPVTEQPVVDETPVVEEAPAIEDVAAVEEAPVVDEIPVADDSFVEDAPADAFDTVDTILEPQEAADDIYVEEETPASEAANVLSAENLLPKLEKILADEEVASANENEIDLFKKLLSFKDFLEGPEKEAFESGKIRMQLEFIIAKMSGKPGLLKTVLSLIKSGTLGEDFQLVSEEDSEIPSNALITEVLEIMKSLALGLEDQNLAKALRDSADTILEKIQLEDNKSAIF